MTYDKLDHRNNDQDQDQHYANSRCISHVKYIETRFVHILEQGCIGCTRTWQDIDSLNSFHISTVRVTEQKNKIFFKDGSVMYQNC